MSEYLEKRCVNLGIKLVFTYNKTTVLSAEIRNEKPLIIADMLFKDCPDSVSQAILDFFTDIKYKSSHEKVIRDYVNRHIKSYSGNIKHLDLSHLIEPVQSIDADYKVKFDMESIDVDNINVNDPDLVEYKIYTINSKDFWGGEKQYRSNTSIKPLKDAEMELNIVVLPPGT